MLKLCFQGREINLAAFRLARQVADEENALVFVSLSEPLSVREDASEEQIINCTYENHLLKCVLSKASRAKTSLLIIYLFVKIMFSGS